MYKSIPSSDIEVRPLSIYKEWDLDETDTDISLYFGEEDTGSLFRDTDEKSNGEYKRLIYNTIKHQYYRNSSTGSIITEVGFRKSYASTDERKLETEMAVIVIPQSKYGEGIKRGSLRLTSGSTVYEDDSYSNLTSASVICGNVFYDRGLVVLTKDVVSGSTLSTFDLHFRSTVTIYENEVFISILENEFNVSQNPTSVDLRGDEKYIKYETFTSSFDGTTMGGFADYDKFGKLDPTGSYLAPYITAIGLYDDNLNMVAVAKLPNPIKSLPDYPINFIVRFDT